METVREASARETNAGIGDIVRRFIVDGFVYDETLAYTLDRRMDLIDDGILDSLGIHELIVFLEERFHLKVEDEEVLPENLATIEAIERYVEKKQTEARPEPSANGN